MAFDTNGINLGQTMIDAALAMTENVDRVPAQFARQGRTAKWFRPRHRIVEGERTRYRVFTEPYSGARGASFATAAASEGPIPRGLGHAQCSFGWDDVFMVRAGIKWNMMQDLKHKNLKVAVYHLVEELFSQASLGVDEYENIATMTPMTGELAQVDTMYEIAQSPAGTQTPFGQTTTHTPAFMRIKGGPITRFKKGDVIDVFVADSTQVAMLKVWGVIGGENGPPTDGVRSAGIGPGLIVEPCNTAGAVASNNWVGAKVTGVNDTEYTSAAPAAGNIITRSGEYTTPTLVAAGTAGKTFHGIPDFFDTTVRIFRDGAEATMGDLLDREATGNEWMNPTTITPDGASAGSEVEFDPEEHLMELADNWIYMVRAGRAGRKSLGVGMPDGVNQTIEISDHLVMVCEPKMANHLTQLSANKNQFTASAAMNDATAKRLKLIGVEGFDGWIWNSPTLNQVAIQVDTNCKPHHMFILEPSSFFWVEPRNGHRVQWLPFSNGSRIWAISGSGEGTRGTPTFERQAMAYTMRGLLNDQPGANAMIEHVCTAREAA